MRDRTEEYLLSRVDLDGYDDGEVEEEEFMADTKTPTERGPKAAHTPTPWIIWKRGDGSIVTVPALGREWMVIRKDTPLDDRWIAAVVLDQAHSAGVSTTEAEQLANAEFFIHATCCHEELIRLVRDFCWLGNEILAGSSMETALAVAVTQAEEVLRKAESTDE